MKIKSERGQILNEAVVALGLVTVGIVAIFGFLTKAISQGRYIADQTAAVNLAAEGIEIAKNILDANALSVGGSWKDGGFNVDGYYELDYTNRSLTDASRPRLDSHEAADTLFFDRTTGLYGHTQTLNAVRTTFKRTVFIKNTIGDHQIKATSKVSWVAPNQRLNEVSVVTDMFDWR